MENPRDSEERVSLTTKRRDPPGPAQDRPMEEEDAEEIKKEEDRDEDDEVELNDKHDAAPVPEEETANDIVDDVAADVDGDYYNSTISALSEDRWEEMYQKLLEFKEIFGHCLVPNRYKEDLQLGAWVSAQRKNYKLLEANSSKSTPLTMERAQRLMDAGFEWTAKNPRHLMWEVRFAELKDFKTNYGHAQVPIGWEQNVQLANWVSTQRQEYKNLIKGKTSRLNDKRVELLNSLGFAWELQRGGRRRRLNVTKGNHPGAEGTPPGHPADKNEGPPAKKAKVLARENFAVDDGTPARRSSSGRKRTTLKKKVTNVDGSSKCILPGVAIMGGGREATTPRSNQQERHEAGSQSGSPVNNSNSGNNISGTRPPFQQQPAQQQQMPPQHAFSNEALLRMLGANNSANPWQLLPNGAYQQMGNPFMGHQGPMGGNPFYPMASGPFGMNPFAGSGFDPHRCMDPSQYPEGPDHGGSMFSHGMAMGLQEMGVGRIQHPGGFGNGPQQDSHNQRQPFFVPSSGGGGQDRQEVEGNNDAQQQGNNIQQQQNAQNNRQMQPQGPVSMMPQHLGLPAGWNPGMSMGQQGPYWNDSNAAAAAAAAQHLQAAAALTAGMDERSLPPALAPLASVARQMNGMLGQQGMNGGLGSNYGPGSQNGANMMHNSSTNQHGPKISSNGPISNSMPNMTNHVRGRRGDPPADPPTGAALSNLMDSAGGTPDRGLMKKMRMKQGVFEDADEEDD